MHCSATLLAWGITILSGAASAKSHLALEGRNHDLAHRSDFPAIPLASTPTCDATEPKFGINNVLCAHNEQLRDASGSIMDLTSQVDQSNAQDMAASIAAELQKLVAAFKFCLSSVQLCGMDPRPLSANKGTTLSDVSWSALQVVLTLKSIFESVSCLYKPFPIVQKTCSGILMSLSTALASLIGACSEQLNLFDTRFFPLVTPQLKEFAEVDDNFSSFFGSFVPT